MADGVSSGKPSDDDQGKRANLSVPQHKELSVGTLRTLIRHAEMTVEEFLALL